MPDSGVFREEPWQRVGLRQATTGEMVLLALSAEQGPHRHRYKLRLQEMGHTEDRNELFKWRVLAHADSKSSHPSHDRRTLDSNAHFPTKLVTLLICVRSTVDLLLHTLSGVCA